MMIRRGCDCQRRGQNVAKRGKNCVTAREENCRMALPCQLKYLKLVFS